MLLGDLETNGLLDTATKIHCAVFYDTETKEYISFTPENVRDIPSFLDKHNQLAFHNGVVFDLPILKKILNYEFKGTFYDTVIISRILWPDLTVVQYTGENGKPKSTKGAHSIETWGVRFNISKPTHEDWETYSEEMLHRCHEDVRIMASLWTHITSHVNTLISKDKRLDKLFSIFSFEQAVTKVIEQQANNGWAFDLELGFKLTEQLKNICESTEQTLTPLLPSKIVPVGADVCKAFKADGSITTNASKWVGGDESLIGGDFCKINISPFNINSEQQLKTYLLSHGWEPSEWNYKKDRFNKPVKDEKGKRIQTSPVLPKTPEEWHSISKQINMPAIRELATYNKASHRLSQLKGLIEAVRLDHRIEAQAIACATNTARMRHKTVVNIPKAQEDVFYGKEFRSLFTCAEGKVLVGCDASALEARCEAHYLFPFDRFAAKELLEGDIHTVNAEVWGVERGLAKAGKYALTYGCSAAKLAYTLKKPQALSKELYERFWEANPGLAQLKEMVGKSWKQRGYLLAVDGRPLSIRYEHALINTLFQSCGSILMKKALLILNDKLYPEFTLEQVKFVGNFHDEFALETSPDIAEIVAQYAVASIEEAGKFFNMNVPFTGEAHIGKNWAEIH